MLAGKLAMAQGQWAQATTYIDRASAQFKDTNLEVLALSARVRQLSGETGAAASRYRAILERHPGILPVRLELAQLLLQMRQYEEAQGQLSTVLAATPNDPRAIQLQGALLLQMGDTDKALEMLAKVDATQNPEAPLTLAQAQIQAGRLAEARKILQPRFESNPKDSRLMQLMLRTAANPQEAKDILATARAGGANPDMIDVLEKSMDQSSNLTEVVEGMIDRGSDPFQQAMQRFNLYRQTGRLDDARNELTKAAALKKDDPNVIEAQFNLAMELKLWDLAKEHADRATSANLDLAEGQFYQGQLALAQGQHERAIATFRKGLSLRPVYSDGWRMLGDAQRLAGEMAESANSYRTALDQLPTNVMALRGMAGALDLQKDHAEALNNLRKAVDLAPNDRGLVQQYLNYEEIHGDPSRALTMRQRMLLTNPNDTGNQRATAILMARTGQFDQAQKSMQDLMAAEGRTTVNLAAMVTVLSIADRKDQARQLLLEHLRDKGDKATAEDWILLAKFNLSNGGDEEALYAFRKAIAVEDPTTRAASRELADLLFDRGLFGDALTYYQQLHEVDKNDTRVAHRYTEALLRAGNKELAETILTDIKKRQGTQADAASRAITWVLEGMVAKARDQDDRAVKALQQAIALQPTRALFHYQLAEHLFTKPERDKLTIDTINRALELDRNLTPARLLLARVHARQRDIPEAIRDLTALLKYRH
ncbi:MAG: tetratricopeptide repeat protein, partial [Phycisphaerales bacterium]|nr:tetratricopeptide repeat protein [Phycisphaerales bacterium]